MAYFSNGFEGMVFDEQCCRCKYGRMPCPIAWVQRKTEKYKEELKGLIRLIRTESEIENDPFVLYQRGEMSKGALLDIIVRELIKSEPPNISVPAGGCAVKGTAGVFVGNGGAQ